MLLNSLITAVQSRHPGAVVIPAALAMGEKLGSSGEDLITAIAAGYELMIRVSYAMDNTNNAPGLAYNRYYRSVWICCCR